jgi:hypothetical protein
VEMDFLKVIWSDECAVEKVRIYIHLGYLEHRENGIKIVFIKSYRKGPGIKYIISGDKFIQILCHQ